MVSRHLQRDEGGCGPTCDAVLTDNVLRDGPCTRWGGCEGKIGEPLRGKIGISIPPGPPNPDPTEPVDPSGE